MTLCSTAFTGLGNNQAKALKYPDLPLLIAPHPFGALKRDKVRAAAEHCVADLMKLLSGETSDAPGVAQTDTGPATVSVEDDLDAVNRLFREHKWGDGLPIVPPTPERLTHMLAGTQRNPRDIIGLVAPGFGAATVERIAINAVMAGCEPACLPVLIAAVDAVCSPEFNLQGIQATTNPVAVWLLVNGPIVQQLDMNFGPNCLGQGNWANATLGRALRLILQNVGRALPGEMDRATHGQPGKYLFCCAENEADNPWEPLNAERGFAGQSTVTVIGAEGTTNMNTHSKIADDIIRVVAETMKRPAGNDYRTGGEPWLVFSPEHAEILKAGGYSKAEVKRRLWEKSKMPASMLTDVDMRHSIHARHAELGDMSPATLLPVCTAAENLGLIVAGGPGTHSIYVSSFGNTRSVTRAVEHRQSQENP